MIFQKALSPAPEKSADLDSGMGKPAPIVGETAGGGGKRACERCDNHVSGHELICQQCYDDDAAYDDDANDCANCGGEGFTYGCGWDWQCDTWDGDNCLCTRRCEWCTPLKPAELAERAALQQVIATTFAPPTCQTCHGTGELYRQDCGAHGLTKPCPDCAAPTPPQEPQP